MINVKYNKEQAVTINRNIILIASVFVFFLLGLTFFIRNLLISYGYPTELPDTLTTGQGDPVSDRVSLFNDLDSSELISLIPFYATDDQGNKYTVYCLEKDKDWAPNQTITKSEEVLDKGYIYLIQNGYPAKSLTGNNAYDDYLTQVAVWLYQDRSSGISDEVAGVLTVNQKNAIKNSEYYTIINNLVTGALNAKENASSEEASFTVTSSNFKLSADHSYLITDMMYVSGNVSFDSYQLSLNNSNVQVLDENDAPLTGTIASNQGFKLKIDLQDITTPTSLNVDIIINYSEYAAYSYLPPDNLADDMQKSFVSTLVSFPKQKSINTTLEMPTGSLTIKKVDNNNTPLAGASIEVRRVATNTVVATFDSTTEDYVINNLPLGEYKITELSAPKGYYISDANETITVLIDTTNLNIEQTLTNNEFSVKIRKIDSETKEPISGAILKILDSTNATVTSITTTTDYIEIPNLQAGTYKVIEEQAPNGYLLNDEEQTFTIDKDNTEVTIDFPDTKNEVIIEKRDATSDDLIAGATLELINTDTNETIKEWTSSASEGYSIKGLPAGNYKVIETSPPSGYTLSTNELTFSITNTLKENLTLRFYNTKNQITINKIDSETKEALAGAEMKIFNSSNEKVASFTTTTAPYVISKLSPGTYYLEETKAPAGYTLNQERKEFTITNTTTNLTITLENTKNKLQIGKIDGTTNEYVAGAKLKLTDSNNKTIAEFTSGNELYTIEKLPSGTYYLEELEAPSNYIRNNKKVPITIKDTDSIVTYNMANNKVKVQVNKIDADTNKLLPGIIFELLDSNKEELLTFTTENIPTTFVSLAEGTYYLKEIKTIDGYILDDTLHEFVISEDHYDFSITLENKPTTVALGKIDAKTKEYIAGATLELTKVDGNMEPLTFTSTTAPYLIKGLAPGLYTLKELKAPAGYVLANSSITFELKETGEVTTVNITNDITTISINNNRLEVDTKGVAGYKFRLETPSGNVITEFTTTEEKYLSDTLANGDYILRQIEVPAGVILNSEPLYFTVASTNQVAVVNFVNDFTKVMISKKDMANGEELPGATLIIYNDKGEVVDQWTSTNEAHYIERLPVGYYTLKEINAPDGYILNTATVDFKVLETGEISTTTMFNAKPIDVPNTGSSTTIVYLIGGFLIIIGGSLMFISYKKGLLKSR